MDTSTTPVPGKLAPPESRPTCELEPTFQIMRRMAGRQGLAAS